MKIMLNRVIILAIAVSFLMLPFTSFMGNVGEVQALSYTDDTKKYTYRYFIEDFTYPNRTKDFKFSYADLNGYTPQVYWNKMQLRNYRYINQSSFSTHAIEPEQKGLSTEITLANIYNPRSNDLVEFGLKGNYTREVIQVQNDQSNPNQLKISFVSMYGDQLWMTHGEDTIPNKSMETIQNMHLKVDKEGLFFKGFYSLDNGQNWNEIGDFGAIMPDGAMLGAYVSYENPYYTFDSVSAGIFDDFKFLMIPDNKIINNPILN
jgi:hypothetical protein